PNPPVNCSTVDPTDCNYQPAGSGYSVTETPNAAWTTQVSCVSSLGGTEVPTNINLSAGEVVTCTFTNTNLCAGKECNDNNVCTTDSCDPNTGQCVNDPAPNVGNACGDQSSGVCDNPNTCDPAGHCQDNFKPSTTICRASAGQCDVAESCTGTSAACPA